VDAQLSRHLVVTWLSWSLFRSGCLTFRLRAQHVERCPVWLSTVQAQLAGLRVSVPVVLITGHDSDETRALALAGFPVAYLRKPVNDQLLLDAIALALRRSQQHLEASNNDSLNQTSLAKEPIVMGKITEI